MPNNAKLKEVVHSGSEVSRYVSRRPSTIWTRLSPLMRYSMYFAVFVQLCALWSPLYSSLGRYIIPQRTIELVGRFSAQDPKCYAFILLLLCYLIYRCYPIMSDEETLLVMRSIGVQTTTRGTSRFMPIDDIEDIIIHEGFKGFEVRFYLAIVLKDSTNASRSRLEIVFPDTLPRRKFLEQVWVDARRALFDK